MVLFMSSSQFDFFAPLVSNSFHKLNFSSISTRVAHLYKSVS